MSDTPVTHPLHQQQIVDYARIQQQIGNYPEPHVFNSHPHISHMCRIAIATQQDQRAQRWHITPNGEVAA